MDIHVSMDIRIHGKPGEISIIDIAGNKRVQTSIYMTVGFNNA